MISPQQIDQVVTWLSDKAIDDGIDKQLRQTFSDIHFTYCMDDDVIAATPVYEHEKFNLYLVDSSSHCLCFTQDMDTAGGLVVAEIEVL